MAEKENKTELEQSDAAAKKPAKETKPKEDKPSLGQRIGTWFKSLKSECKKISWASWSSVRSNSLIVIVAVIIVSVVLGILDYCFSGAIVGLSRII